MRNSIVSRDVIVDGLSTRAEGRHTTIPFARRRNGDTIEAVHDADPSCSMVGSWGRSTGLYEKSFSLLRFLKIRQVDEQTPMICGFLTTNNNLGMYDDSIILNRSGRYNTS